jgi:hypothetical protein
MVNWLRIMERVYMAEPKAVFKVYDLGIENTLGIARRILR